MPFYDYKCPHCFNENEVQHFMKEEPIIKCDVCGFKRMEKQISQINANFKTGNTLRRDDVKNEVKKVKDMHVELREDFGVHDVTLTQPGMSYKHIYQEIKGNGREVRDTMKEKAKENESKMIKKNKEQKKKFNETMREKRIVEVKERKAKREFEKRKIDPIKGVTV